MVQRVEPPPGTELVHLQERPHGALPSLLPYEGPERSWHPEEGSRHKLIQPAFDLGLSNLQNREKFLVLIRHTTCGVMSGQSERTKAG